MCKCCNNILLWQVTFYVNNKEEAGIQLVDVGEAATVISTSRGDVYLLHKYICKKIAIKLVHIASKVFYLTVVVY